MNESREIAGSLNADGTAPRAGRRRFLGASASATPALLTLVSQPALGTGVNCFTPSRSTSKNTSVSQAGKFGQCTGTSVATYKTMSTWPASFNKATAFHPFFGGSRMLVRNAGGTQTRSLTFGELMAMSSPTSGPFPNSFPSFVTTPSSNEFALAQHIIAAHLNVLAGLVPSQVLTHPSTATIPSPVSLWNLWSPSGSLQVTATVSWNAGQFRDYLISNGIAPAV